jgi:glycosyltransferase involved in cell wall biosynthesis
MKILHVVSAFFPATYWGGPIYSLYGLCNALAKMSEIELRVLTTDSSGPHRSNSVQVNEFPVLYPGGYEVFFSRRWWGATISPGLLMRLTSMIRWADVVHLTGVYSPPTIPTLFITRLMGKPVIWSPRGALQRWEGATRPTAKRLWEYICNALVRPTHCTLHVTSKEEALDSQSRIPNARLTIIPNGVEVPEPLPDREWVPDGTLRLLYIGRLHPKKGIENLLQALKNMNDWSISLRICGSGDSAYSQHLQRLIQQLGLKGCIEFDGHVDGEKKTQSFMNSDACVVPSFTENFGMVVAEALAHGIPVIASKGTPWRDIEKHGCGLWVDNSPESLAEAIGQIKSASLSEMGQRGRKWMNENYSWSKVAAQVFFSYRSVTSRY